MKIRLHLSYDGTDYGGWQRQNAGKPTVQGTLEKALTRLFDSPVTVRGAGRTDAGVHAASQVAHFLAPKPIENYNLVVGINSLTPSSLAVTEAFVAPDDFHALASATKKLINIEYLIHRPQILCAADSVPGCEGRCIWITSTRLRSIC